jgi:F420-0:gamma-glutamyl ligase-like protein
MLPENNSFQLQVITEQLQRETEDRKMLQDVVRSQALTIDIQKKLLEKMEKELSKSIAYRGVVE